MREVNGQDTVSKQGRVVRATVVRVATKKKSKQLNREQKTREREIPKSHRAEIKRGEKEIALHCRGADVTEPLLSWPVAAMTMISAAANPSPTPHVAAENCLMTKMKMMTKMAKRVRWQRRQRVVSD